jgi:NhaA family Na+:H+ antiporter
MASRSTSLAPRTHAAPPEAWEPLLRVARFARRPLDRFLRIEAASGVLLLAAAALALAWANGPLGASYARFWHAPIGVRIGAWSFERPLEWVVNDGLMTLFFFLVGLEIRREIHHGELSEMRRAALPVAAALGGMIAPALLYLRLAGGPGTRAGWGVPMATDIAFAVGVLALLGKRVPPALRVLLLALAVIDDLGAIVVIAAFYSGGVQWAGFAVAAVGVLCIFAQQRLGVRAKLAYVPAALLAWAGTYASGVHPTIAGVVVGALTPVRAWLGVEGFTAEVNADLARLEAASGESGAARDPHALGEILAHVDHARREAISPSEALIEALHPWAAFVIMPLFALANAGVVVGEGSLGSPAALGVIVGLVLGKPLGVLLVSLLTLRLGWAALPAGIRLRHLVVLGVVAGIGFTMSLFVAQLAFADAATLASAKLAILAASGASGVLALACGRLLLPARAEHGAAESADEAEASTDL